MRRLAGWPTVAIVFGLGFFQGWATSVHHHQPLGLGISEWAFSITQLIVIAAGLVLAVVTVHCWRRDEISLSEGLRASSVEPAATAVAVILLIVCGAAVGKLL